MAGLIKREDIEEVRNRTDIKEVIDGYVTLKSAGVGSWKGLCPFHDERSPSFHVRPQVGTFHCFGCGESGDVIAFIQKMDHSTFSETVETLAARAGIELHYEDGGTGPRREDVGRRQRLLDAHKVAEEYFREQLATPVPPPARSSSRAVALTRTRPPNSVSATRPRAGTRCSNTCTGAVSKMKNSSSPAFSPRATAASTTVSAAG